MGLWSDLEHRYREDPEKTAREGRGGRGKAPMPILTHLDNECCGSPSSRLDWRARRRATTGGDWKTGREASCGEAASLGGGSGWLGFKA